jgi:hypothetical protein
MRNLFDQYAKEALCALLTPAGPVEPEKEVRPDAQRIDLYFVPEADRASALNPLGLLGRLASGPCSLEHFHDSPSPAELVACLRKHLNFCHLLPQQPSPRPPPMMWILSSGRPTSALKGLGLGRARGWPKGIYVAAPLLHLGVVVLSELRALRETLSLRLLGAGMTLKRATAELRALPPDAPEVRLVLPIMLRFRLAVPADPDEQTTRDKEFLMSTQDALELLEQQLLEKGMLKGLEQGIQKGLEQGIQKGLEQGIQKGLAPARRALLMVYEVRFGPPPAAVQTRVQAVSDPDTLTRWTDVVGSEPRERVDQLLTGE